METFPIPKQFPYTVNTPEIDLGPLTNWLASQGLQSGFGYLILPAVGSGLTVRFREANDASMFKLAWGQKLND